MARGPLGHRRRVRVEVDEDEAADDLGACRGEADLRAVEAGHLLRARRAPQASVELVAPGVVGAHQRALAARALHQPVSAVHAHVVEGANLPVRAAQAEQAAAVQLEGEVVAPLLELRDVARVLPGAPEEPLALALELIRIGVMIAIDAPQASFDAHVKRARAAGASDEEIVGVPASVATILGVPRLLASLPRIKVALEQ